MEEICNFATILELIVRGLEAVATILAVLR